VASVGNVLVIADYSQIELRTAAYFSGDKRMIEAFIKGENLHTKTASIVLGKSEKEITNEDWQLTTPLNSGSILQALRRVSSFARESLGRSGMHRSHGGQGNLRKATINEPGS
jgi:hypothetical protein